MRSVPSAARESWWMTANVPTVCNSFGSVSSPASFFWATRATKRLARIASFTSLTEPGRPTARGTTARGNTTALRSGSTGSESGIRTWSPPTCSAAGSRVSSAMSFSSTRLGYLHSQQSPVVARLNAVPLDLDGEQDFHPERSLADTRRVVHALIGHRKIPAALDQQRVLEQQDLELLHVHAGKFHGHGESGLRFIDVHVRVPVGVGKHHLSGAHLPQAA